MSGTGRRRLNNQVVLVTGASAGIGQVTCVAVAREGASVVAVGRDKPRLEKTAAMVREQGGRSILTMSLDVTREGDMRRMAQGAIEAFGRIDVLVHAAGILRASGSSFAPVAQMPTHDFEQVIDINLRGTFLANRAVLPQMIRQRRGDIVNISSKSGRKGLAYDAPYCASKFGVIGLTDALSDEVRSNGVRVQSLLPGTFETGVWSQAALPKPPHLPPAERIADLIVHMVTMPRNTCLSTPIIEPLFTQANTGWRNIHGPTKPISITPRATSARPEKELIMNQAQNNGQGRLSDQVVIVTGATGGIGSAVCHALARAGASVVVADIRPDKIDRTVAELVDISGGASGTLANKQL